MASSFSHLDPSIPSHSNAQSTYTEVRNTLTDPPPTEIQKAFGESTADGLEWQFRGIKKLAKAQNDAVAKGESPADLNIGKIVGGGGGVSTPSARSRGTASAASTPRTGGAARTPGSRASKLGTTGAATPGSAASGGGQHKRRFGAISGEPSGSEYEGQDDTDYDVVVKSGGRGRGDGGPDPDETPTGRKKRQPRSAAEKTAPVGGYNVAAAPASAGKPGGTINAAPNATAGGKQSIFNNSHNHNLFDAHHDVVDLADEDIDEDVRAAARVKTEPGIKKQKMQATATTSTTSAPAFSFDDSNGYDSIPNPFSSSSYQAGSGYFGSGSGDGGDYGQNFDLEEGEA